MTNPPAAQDLLMTVTGPVKPEALGFTLPHEHVMSTFGADPARYPEYPVQQVLDQALPYLAKLKALGCQAILDCTAAYFGRHPELLRRIAQESGLHIFTNTGYYGAAYGKYIPAHAQTESALEIAARWTREWTDGIDETGVRPGFIKTAVGDGELSEVNAKLIQAAILTHLQTGLTIQTHLGDNAPAGESILQMLAENGVKASAWVWVHAHAMPEAAPLLDAARLGAWISLDGVREESAEHILGFLQALKAAGLLNRALLSHDGDSYCMGDFRPYEYILTHFTGQLLANGFTPLEVERLTVTNPSRAFTVRVRAV
jgi:predicted metal-dependent phosphotriesterase family hydrolase